MSSLGVPGVPWHPQILADQLTLSQPEGTDYSHLLNYRWHTQIFRPSDGPELWNPAFGQILIGENIVSFVSAKSFLNKQSANKFKLQMNINAVTVNHVKVNCM